MYFTNSNWYFTSKKPQTQRFPKPDGFQFVVKITAMPITELTFEPKSLSGHAFEWVPDECLSHFSAINTSNCQNSKTKELRYCPNVIQTKHLILWDDTLSLQLNFRLTIYIPMPEQLPNLTPERTLSIWPKNQSPL